MIKSKIRSCIFNKLNFSKFTTINTSAISSIHSCLPLNSSKI